MLEREDINQEETPKWKGFPWGKLILWVLIVIAAIGAAFTGVIYFHHKAPAPAPLQVETQAAPVDTTGAFARAIAEKAKADSLAAQAHQDSLDTAEGNYEKALYWGKIMGDKTYYQTSYDGNKSEVEITDSLITATRAEYDRLLGSGERDKAVVFYEKTLKIKPGSTTVVAKKPTGNNNQQQQKQTTTPNFKVVKTQPFKNYTTQWREWSGTFSWGTMRSNENIEPDFARNLAMIPDESKDFAGCKVQIPNAIKDSLLILRRGDIQSKGDNAYVKYVSINNFLFKGNISNGTISGGAKGEKVQHFDIAPINIHITGCIDHNGKLQSLSKINAKMYIVKLTQAEATAMKLPAKFIPPAGKTLIVEVLFFGDGYGNTPQCNNMCWRAYTS